MQVRLDPLGAFALFGVPVHEMGNRAVELSDLLGADAERWSGRLSDAPDWQSRFALLDGVLAGRSTSFKTVHSDGPTVGP